LGTLTHPALAHPSRDQIQPLHLIASGLESEGPVVLCSKNGNFNDLASLAECMRASMLLPGIAGPVVRVPNVGEPMCDALLYEQVPYRSALVGGATHGLVLRSRPDGIGTLAKQSVLERMMLRRFWRRKNRLPAIHGMMKQQRHRIR